MVDYPDENPQSKDSVKTYVAGIRLLRRGAVSSGIRLEKRMLWVYVYSDEVLYPVTYVWRNVYPRSYIWSISSLALEIE